MSESNQSLPRKLTANLKAAGCAAKISSADLSQIIHSLSTLSCPELLTSIEHFEDAAVYKLADDLAMIQSLDFFPPVVDDPYIFGQIAAANALSDIYAMGGRPVMALNILAFPTCDYPMEVVQDILRGGADKVMEAGAVLAGGHSIQAAEPLFGMSVTGLIHPSKILTNGGARPGDQLVLCKPVGTGIALLGAKGGVLSQSAGAALLNNLTTLNRRALEIALHHSPHGATDITGFGLFGHLHEMAAASGLKLRLFAEQVRLLPESRELAEQGFVPAAAYANRKSFEAFVENLALIDTALADLFFDPQTSGGLLFALEAGDALRLVTELNESDISACLIGQFSSGSAGIVEVIRHATEN